MKALIPDPSPGRLEPGDRDRIAAELLEIKERFCPECGGDTDCRRRIEGTRVVTYYRCAWCYHLQPMFYYDVATRTHGSLLPAE